tara:strand:+ start:11 stop:505 length:495 start_codon:yes stop_codon:yes gene_type:complete
MPQLDVETFLPQLVWLTITFTILYFIMSKAILPKIADVLEQRQDRIASDLEEAEKFKNETEEVMKLYEETLKSAQIEAQEILNKNKQLALDEIAQQTNKLEKEMQQKAVESEERISKLKKDALNEIKFAAGDSALVIVSKLANLNIDKEFALETALKQLSEKKL